MIYVAVESIMGIAERVHFASPDWDKVTQHINESSQMLYVETLTPEQYKQVVENGDYISEGMFD